MENKQQARELNNIAQMGNGFFKELFNMSKNDPVKNCALFKDKGCAHVDGMLCDFPNCQMNEEYIAERKLKEFEDYTKVHDRKLDRVTKSNYTKPKKKRK